MKSHPVRAAIILPRLQLFEFEDLPWFPKILRNYMTDFLSQAARMTGLFDDSFEVLAGVIRTSGVTTILDLASGGGGGLPPVAARLKREFPNLKVYLTDLYPNSSANEKTVAHYPNIYSAVTTPVDAMNVPEDLTGIRTMFLSFHHFRYEDAKKILQNAVDRGQPIAVFEAQQRTLLHLIPMILSPLSTLLVTPFIRPFRAGRLFFTYILPVLLVTIMWDGIVSVFRTYTIHEMEQMISETDGSENFHWQTGVTRPGPRGIMYLTGVPKENLD